MLWVLLGLQGLLPTAVSKVAQCMTQIVRPNNTTHLKAYKKSDGPTINHFYEKLLPLKDRMFTKTGKEIAQHRHEVMEQFLKEFYDEWDGKR